MFENVKQLSCKGALKIKGAKYFLFFFELYSGGDPHCGNILRLIKISKKLYKAWGWHDPHNKKELQMLHMVTTVQN